MQIQRPQKTDIIATIMCISFISLLMGAVGNQGRENAKQVVCATHIKQNLDATLTFAETQNGDLKALKQTGNWLQDSSTELVYTLKGYGVRKKMLYCPSNDVHQVHMDNFYYFTTDTDAGTTGTYRVLGYCFLLNVQSPQRKARDSFAVKSTYIDHADTVALITDTTMSQTQQDPKTPDATINVFDHIVGGLSSQGIYERTNHLKSSTEPLGGNIGYVDGHVAWRDFADMQYRGDFGPSSWW